MTKIEFISKLSEKLDLTVKQTSVVVNTFFDSIKQSLVKGEKVELRGFGSFRLKVRNARIGRNPKSGATVHIEEKKVPYFKPGKDFRNMIDQAE